MSTFRDAVSGMLGKEVYIVLCENPTKVKIEKITEDLVTLQLLDKDVKLIIHIDNLVFASS